MDLNTLITNFNNLMEAEEQALLGQGLDALRVRYAARENLQGRLDEMATQLDAMNRRMARLPHLPSLEIVEWANAVLAMPNISFLVLDTIGVEPDSDILRVLVTDASGITLLNRIVQSGRQSGPNYNYTGITQGMLKEGVPLAEVWGELATILKGRFVLSYNLKFVRDRLEENAKHYHLEPVCFLGEDLQHKAMDYYNTTYLLSLSDVCHRVGHELPQGIILAADRAQGQLALLRAMAHQGITHSVQPQQPPATFDDSPLGEIDEHPF